MINKENVDFKEHNPDGLKLRLDLNSLLNQSNDIPEELFVLLDQDLNLLNIVSLEQGDKCSIEV